MISPLQALPDRILSVSEISRDIRFALEGKFQGVWIEGEVSNLRLPGSGHHYFTLKDASAQLNCVMFRAAAEQNGLVLRDGMKVHVHGDITVYEQRGQYQLVVRIAQPAGLGELQAKFEALKRKLDAEGLFDPAKKKPIPSFPKTVGVVTSPTGAAIQDIQNVMARRAPWIRLVVIPVRVQGEGSGGEIARAIEFISTCPEHLPAFDTLIVARGGGSIEDLWAFNEEAVARAIYACPIPVISGVGHEIDFTIADFVADRREPTPSAAAEKAVPNGADLLHRLNVLKNRLDGAVESHLRHARNAAEALKREMEARQPARKLQAWAQSMDYLEERLENALTRRLENYRSKLDRIEAILSGWNPARDVIQASEKAARVFSLLEETVERKLDARREQLKHFRHLLRAIGPEKTLKRGFSMTLDEEGNLISAAATVKDGQLIKTRFADGEIKSRVE